MLKVSLTAPGHFLRDGKPDELYLTQLSQLGVDCIDITSGSVWPGVREQGYPDLDEVLRIKRRIAAYGLQLNRVTLPDLTEAFMLNRPGCEKELENACNAVKVFGEARIPVVRQRFAGDSFTGIMEPYDALHRGGSVARGERLRKNPAVPTHEELSFYWERFCEAYRELVPLAEAYDLQLAMHPSDTPNPETPFNSLGFHRIIDAFPSKSVGFIYCVGTRAQAGGSSLVLDEIRQFGRKGRIFSVHFRNVRGSLPTVGGFEESMLDDGDMNMFRILMELRKTGYDGCINPDHVPRLTGDDAGQMMAWAYAVGYIKALINAADGL
ncbi:mannonate dehydratase [Paenibacillus sp.]|uniref:mannonate dehydratase n=1 Tax=Paenibacillus sp. TaxID=58172 RepID=UPI002D651FC0|nr:mannonate dehydratase [Paenibacillus sp.]HZG56233.1 mannonate dehydratase [Paenibacillus sp.]